MKGRIDAERGWIWTTIKYKGKFKNQVAVAFVVKQFTTAL
jgi:hypothetical protein